MDTVNMGNKEKKMGNKYLTIWGILFRVLIVAATIAPCSLIAQIVETRIPPIQTEGGRIAGLVLPSGVKSLARRSLRKAASERSALATAAVHLLEWGMGCRPQDA